jgi:nucleotide-binding universal stress UspA family protein
MRRFRVAGLPGLPVLTTGFVETASGQRRRARNWSLVMPDASVARTIVVAGDGSKASEIALEHGHRYRAAVDGKLVAVRVVDPGGEPGRVDSTPVVGSVTTCPEPVAIARIGEERASRALLRATRELGAGQLFMATRGTGWRHRSVAAECVDTAAMPVTVVGPRVQRPQRSGPLAILLALPGDEALLSSAIDVFRPMVAGTTAELHFAAIAMERVGDSAGSDPAAHGRSIAQTAARLLQWDRALVETDVVAPPWPGDEARALAVLADDLRPDLLVVAARPRGFWSRLFAGAGLYGVVDRSRVPVVVLPITQTGAR